MPRLIVSAGPDLGKQFPLRLDLMTVGRHSTNPISLTDSTVSRKHFELLRDAGKFRLQDLGSGNGTKINGLAVKSQELQNGDAIQIGDTTLIYYSEDFPSTQDHHPGHVDVHLYATPEHTFLSSIVQTIPADAGSRILANPSQAVTDWLKGRLACLTVLYEATHAVSDILDMDELLERIMKLLLPAADADRGCFMITDAETGELMPKAIQSRIASGTVAVSRTVIDYVLKEKHGVLISDARADERFRGGESIRTHNLHEVICVPMKGRHETVGVLFLDTKTDTASKSTRFTEDHLQLAVAVAHHAALAVEETRYYQAMVNAERLAAIGQTIAAMSHHIKNVFHGVRFGSDMVRTALAEDDRNLLQKGWKLVERNLGRIDELILDMLSYSKERDPAIEPTDMVKLLEDVLEMVAGRAGERSVSITFDKPVGLPLISCDSEGMHRALLNVISNGIEALEGREQPRLTIALEYDDKELTILITDNGTGVPLDRQEEIFKPFFSSKGSRGTGLGLPVSRKILREHKGDLVIDPTYREGCRFVFRLPMSS